MNGPSLHQWLLRDLRPAARRIEATRVVSLASQIAEAGIDEEQPTPSEVIGALVAITNEEIQGIAELRRSYVDFAANYQRASDGEEQSELILDFAERLGSSGVALREDRRALRRW